MKSLVTKKLQELENSLKASNTESSDFFKGVRERIEQCESDDALIEILESLRTIGTISQYADFNFVQDQLLNDLLKENRKELERLKNNFKSPAE